MSHTPSTNSTLTEFLPNFIDYNAGPAVLWSLTMIGFVTLIIVGLRLWARRIKGLSFGLDDWLIIACVPLVIGSVVCAICAVLIGQVGRHTEIIELLNPGALSRSLAALFAVEIIYIVLLALAKLSVLAMYWRIFSTGFVIVRRGCIILSILTFLWLLAGAIGTCIQCRPLRSIWTSGVVSHCYDPGKLAVANAVPNMIIDLAILLLPVYEISRLSMAIPHKIGIAGIFLLGLFTSLVSGIRLIYLIRLFRAGPGLDLAVLICIPWVLTVVEGESAVICACLPLLKPVIQKAYRRIRPHSFEKEASEGETTNIVMGVVTIGGTGGSHGRGGSCQAPDPFAEDTDVEAGFVPSEYGSGNAYSKGNKAISETEESEDAKGIGPRQDLATSII